MVECDSDGMMEELIYFLEYWIVVAYHILWLLISEFASNLLNHSLVVAVHYCSWVLVTDQWVLIDVLS